jgi:hypothetical protein
MPVTNAQLVGQVTRYLRAHPGRDVSDEELAEAIGLNLKFDTDTVINPARLNYAAELSERTDLTGGDRSAPRGTGLWARRPERPRSPEPAPEEPAPDFESRVAPDAFEQRVAPDAFEQRATQEM